MFHAPHEFLAGQHITLDLGGQSDITLTTELTNAGWDGSTPINVIIRIVTGQKLSSTATGTPALIIDVLPADSKVFLINDGEITGKGGAPAANGGPALQVDTQVGNTIIAVDNLNGEINGGGGGGSTGGTGAPGSQGVGTTVVIKACEQCFANGGAGGAGGAGGSGYGPNAQTAGAAGEPGLPGACCGGDADCVQGCGTPGGTGGTGASGGGKGQEGVGGGGGSPGNSINGNANITWINFGVRNGPIT